MTDERTTAYLLNELTETEAERFEEQCFAKPEWPDVELDSAEEDLIQAYLKEELSPERRRRFEEHYLTTDARRERVLLARSFLNVVCLAGPPKLTWKQKLVEFLKAFVSAPQSSVPRFAAIMLAIGLAAIMLYVVIPSRTPQTFAQLSLVNTVSNRGESRQIPKVKLPLAEDALRISLALPEPAPAGTTHRVQWQNVKGPIGDLQIEKQDANSVSVIIPAEKLTRGQYTLKLFRTMNGTEQAITGDYLFEVVE